MVVSPSQAPPGGHSMQYQSLLLLDVSLRYCALPQSAAVVQDGLAQAVCFLLGSSPLPAHVLQLCWPRVSWYWSEGHGEQTPSVLPYLPRSHPLHVAAPSVVVDQPIGQPVQLLVLPCPSEYVDFKHGLHALAPGTSLNVPGIHGKQYGNPSSA